MRIGRIVPNFGKTWLDVRLLFERFMLFFLSLLSNFSAEAGKYGEFLTQKEKAPRTRMEQGARIPRTALNQPIDE